VIFFSPTPTSPSTPFSAASGCPLPAWLFFGGETSGSLMMALLDLPRIEFFLPLIRFFTFVLCFRFFFFARVDRGPFLVSQKRSFACFLFWTRFHGPGASPPVPLLRSPRLFFLSVTSSAFWVGSSFFRLSLLRNVLPLVGALARRWSLFPESTPWLFLGDDVAFPASSWLFLFSSFSFWAPTRKMAF